MLRVLVVVLLWAVGVVYVGTIVQTKASLFPSCTRSSDVDGSTTAQSGHASMRWFPPESRCTFPADDRFGMPAAHEEHFATFWVFSIGFFSAVLIIGTMLATGVGLGEHEDTWPRYR